MIPKVCLDQAKIQEGLSSYHLVELMTLGDDILIKWEVTLTERGLCVLKYVGRSGGDEGASGLEKRGEAHN